MGPRIAKFYQQKRVSKHQVLVELEKRLFNDIAWHLFLRDIECSPSNIF